MVGRLPTTMVGISTNLDLVKSANRLAAYLINTFIGCLSGFESIHLCINVIM